MRIALLFLLLANFTASAQQDNRSSGRTYWSGGLDGALFQSALIQRTGEDDKLGVLRFSGVFNFGYHFNVDAGKHVGFFTGVDVKNIGFIEKESDLTIKRRLYTVGVPLGVKFGNMPGRRYGYVGGGFDVPFNYREKRFVDRGDKMKMNEWFSDRTPRFMPYAFVGYTFLPAFLTVKLQYYPGNFFNQDYQTELNPFDPEIMPYASTEVNLFYLSLGFDIKHKRRQASVTSNPTALVY